MTFHGGAHGACAEGLVIAFAEDGFDVGVGDFDLVAESTEAACSRTVAPKQSLSPIPFAYRQ